MAALVVQSRFAGLKIEDDDYPSSSESQKPKKKQQPTAAAAAAAAVKKTDPPKKNKTTNNKNQTQSVAPKKRKNKAQPSTNQQWEQWKQKDEQLVDGNFENELQQAILLSKLDYEQKKDVYKQIKKQTEVEKKSADQAKSSKKKKKQVMSLEQFNDMVSSGDEPKTEQIEDKASNGVPKTTDKDTEFFERVKDDTKHELLKDKINDRVRNRQTSDEVISRGQFAEVLARKDQEIIALREEVNSLKKELLTVKSRNKKLCNILGQGEMKDKAEVLIEVERLRAVQDELTGELADLHQHLERERSRHQDSRTKDKKKKGGNGDKEK